jgi:hypothetical protein
LFFAGQRSQRLRGRDTEISLPARREQFFEAAKAQAQKDFQEDSTNAHVGLNTHSACHEAGM